MPWGRASEFRGSGSWENGTVEVFVHGRLPDAEYVRDRLTTRGMETTDPKPVAHEVGIMSFRATAAEPLTMQQVMRLLEKDRYLEVL
jgi:hypothetical protein